MNELDILTLTNLLSEDFSWRFNGELKTIQANEVKQFPRDIGLHMAKHLSDKILADENPPKITKGMTDKEQEKEQHRVSNIMVFDNPLRRIALYRILKDPIIVQTTIEAYNLKSFMGDMDVYKQYVIKEKGEFVDKPREQLSPVEELGKKVKELEEKITASKKVEKLT